MLPLRPTQSTEKQQLKFNFTRNCSILTPTEICSKRKITSGQRTLTSSDSARIVAGCPKPLQFQMRMIIIPGKPRAQDPPLKYIYSYHHIHSYLQYRPLHFLLYGTPHLAIVTIFYPCSNVSFFPLRESQRRQPYCYLETPPS